MEIISKGYKFRRGNASPFSAISADNCTGVQWCFWCKDITDIAEIWHNINQVHAFKQICQRCKRPTVSGVYYHVQSLGESGTSTLTRALDWSKEPEK